VRAVGAPWKAQQWWGKARPPGLPLDDPGTLQGASLIGPPKTVIADNGTNDRDLWRPRRQMGRPHTILGRERLRGARWPGSGCTEVQSGEEILGTRCQDGGLRAIAMALEVLWMYLHPD
jgi:hypothetical protein